VNTPVSYGPAFNSNGGGWSVVCLTCRMEILTHPSTRYAVERTDSSINIWFWARNDGLVPSDVANGRSSVNTDHWVSNNSYPHQPLILSNFQGTPTANFPNTSCDIPSHFVDNNILINLTLCTSFSCRDPIELEWMFRRGLGR
jgi:hypothetical protein